MKDEKIVSFSNLNCLTLYIPNSHHIILFKSQHVLVPLAKRRDLLCPKKYKNKKSVFSLYLLSKYKNTVFHLFKEAYLHLWYQIRLHSYDFLLIYLRRVPFLRFHSLYLQFSKHLVSPYLPVRIKWYKVYMVICVRCVCVHFI